MAYCAFHKIYFPDPKLFKSPIWQRPSCIVPFISSLWDAYISYFSQFIIDHSWKCLCATRWLPCYPRRPQQTKWQMCWWLCVKMIWGARMYLRNTSRTTPWMSVGWVFALLRPHNGRDGVSNHQPHHRLLNRSFRRRSKKTSKLRITGLCAGNSPVIPRKWPVTRKMFLFDDVIMARISWTHSVMHPCLLAVSI